MITTKQCDAMYAGIITFANGIEKFMRVIEEYHMQDVRIKVYDKLVNELFTKNLIGGMSRQMAYASAKKEAEKIISESTNEALKEDGPIPVRKFLDKVKEVIDMSDKFTEVGMQDSVVKEGETMANIYDYIQGDTGRMCSLFCRFQNIDGKDDNAERAVHRYETKEIFDEEFMDKWFRTQGVEKEKPKRKRKKKEDK